MLRMLSTIWKWVQMPIQALSRLVFNSHHAQHAYADLAGGEVDALDAETTIQAADLHVGAERASAVASAFDPQVGGNLRISAGGLSVVGTAFPPTISRLAVASANVAAGHGAVQPNQAVVVSSQSVTALPGKASGAGVTFPPIISGSGVAQSATPVGVGVVLGAQVSTRVFALLAGPAAGSGSVPNASPSLNSRAPSTAASGVGNANPVTKLPSAPAAPVLSGVAGDNQCTLTWTTPFNNGSAITGYRVVGTGFLILADNLNANTFVDTTARNGTTQNYFVQAINSAPPSGGGVLFPARGSVGILVPRSSLTITNPTGFALQANTAGQLISGLDIRGGIEVNAPNVTIHNCYIEQQVNGAWMNIAQHVGADNLTITDCTIQPVNGSPNGGRGQAGVWCEGGTSGMTAQRCDISITGQAFLGGENVLIEDTWVHDLTQYINPADGLPTHKEALLSEGGGPTTVRRCRMEPNLPSNFDAQTQTASIFFQPLSDLHDVLITDSFLMGGFYSLRAQDGGNVHVLSLAVTNCVFGPQPPAGGAPYSIDPAVGITQWTNNVLGDQDGNPTTVVVTYP